MQKSTGTLRNPSEGSQLPQGYSQSKHSPASAFQVTPSLREETTCKVPPSHDQTSPSIRGRGSRGFSQLILLAQSPEQQDAEVQPTNAIPFSFHSRSSSQQPPTRIQEDGAGSKGGNEGRGEPNPLSPSSATPLFYSFDSLRTTGTVQASGITFVRSLSTLACCLRRSALMNAVIMVPRSRKEQRKRFPAFVP